MVHQCSIQFAGYHLLTQFIELKHQLLRDYFKVELSDWEGLEGARFAAKFDIWLKKQSEEWLKDERDKAAKTPHFQGLLQLMALGTSGLYYYIGIMLKSLKDKDLYLRSEIPEVYLGGNGARVWHIFY